MIDLRNMDCMDLLRETPDKFYDLAIVDIPYGLGDKLTQGGTWASKYKKGDASWDVLPTGEYFTQLFRISKNQIIWGGNYVELPPNRCYLIWDKVALMDTMADSEYAWTSFNSNAKTFRHVRNTSEKRIHITQKPIELYDWIIKKYAKQGDKLLDTHLGSGSIAIAVLKANNIEKMNLTLTGCELDKDYFDAMQKRIKTFQSQTTIFDI